MISPRTSLLLMVALFGCSRTLHAQFEPSPSVSGTGSVTLTRMPETMRLQVAIMGRGSTLKDALAALKDRTTRAQTQLTALGAEKASIKIGDSKITELPNDRNQQMQMMMLRRMKRGGGKAAQKAPAAPPVLVTAQLTAEWKLSSKTVEELLTAVHPIQEKVKAADLAGSKEAEKLTPEQEELLEEAEGNFGFNSSDEPKPGEPVFMFVSRVSDDERQKALGEAFEKAKAQASRLAAAAGVQLGGLKSLSSDNTGGIDLDGSGLQYGSYAYRAYQLMQRQQMTSNTKENEAEAASVEAGPLKYVVSLTAAFGIESKK